MIGSTSPRTALLIRVYYGLLVVSVALSGVLTGRHVPTAQNAPQEIVKPAPRDANAPRRPRLPPSAAPAINWGGQKHN